MKAIVANVLFGSILGCLSWTNSASAKPLTINSEQFKVPESPILSTNLWSSDGLPIVPHIINLVDRLFTVDRSDSGKFTIDREAEIVFGDRQAFSKSNRFGLNLEKNQGVTLGKSPYTHKDSDSQADLVLGFQKTFWEGSRKKKYWGVTTIEHWGSQDRPKENINIAKLNYTRLASALPRGNSILTVSGGGDNNLAKKNGTSKEFDHFRGGISYHHGVVKDLTMGVGFVYEDFLVGFTQFTYNNNSFPIKTTVSLLTRESGVDFRSHVRFEPAKSFVLNYYHDRDKDKFDASWNLFSGLTLVADGDTEKDKFSTGIKVAVHSDYMSISAKAALDSNNNLQWNLKSNIGGFNFAHGNSKEKSTSKISLNLNQSNSWGFQCSAFVKYENKTQHNENQFVVWGSKLQSGEKITPSKHLWSVNLAYGASNHGEGLIAAGSLALKPNLFLKLSYQEISATSDDTKIKFQISSK